MNTVLINTKVELSRLLALDILNVALRGGCDSWATITEEAQSASDAPLSESAYFMDRERPEFGSTVSTAEVGAGIVALLGKPNTPEWLRMRLLRAVINNDITEISPSVASAVVLAVVRPDIDAEKQQRF